MFMKPYHLTARIDKQFFQQIWDGRKTVEFRPSSENWNARCGKAEKLMKQGYPVIIILMCGRKALRIEVEGIGQITVRRAFWFERGGLSKRIPTYTMESGKVWAIHLADIVSAKGVE